LHLRINELGVAMGGFKSHGERANVRACDALREANKTHWRVNEIRQYWKRVLKRIDVTSRRLVTLLEPASCVAGTLAELVFAADRLTGMEANLRFVGPETMESKIFARLTAWQNWIFQSPNAVGEAGALRSYGTGERPRFHMPRV